MGFGQNGRGDGGSQGSLSTSQGVTSRGDHHHCTPPLSSLVRDVQQEIREGESAVPGSHRLGETEARCKPASLCVAYILLQPVHRGCDLCGSWLPVAFSQGAVQVLLQLITQLRRGTRSVSAHTPPPHLPLGLRWLRILASCRQDTVMTQTVL